jgi:hypothetical protein
MSSSSLNNKADATPDKDDSNRKINWDQAMKN